MAIPHTITGLTDTLTAAPTWAQAAGAAAAFAAAGILATGIHRVRTRIREAGRAKNISALVTIAALIATTVQASGMWKFFGTTMGLPVGFRIFMFSFMEIALLACGMRARANVDEGGDAGIDGILVWVLAMASGLMSATDAATLQEGLMRVLTSVVVALLWSRDLMAAKKAARALADGKKRSSPVRWRITGERIAVALGLADAVDTDVSTVDAARRVGKFLRKSDRERNGYQWPFTAKARAYREQMRLVDEALRHGNPAEIHELLSKAAFADALGRLGIAPVSTGPVSTDAPTGSAVAAAVQRVEKELVRPVSDPDRSKPGPVSPEHVGPVNTERTGQHTEPVSPPRPVQPRPVTPAPDRSARPVTPTGPSTATGQTGQHATTGPTGPGKRVSIDELEEACRAWASAHDTDPAQMNRDAVKTAAKAAGYSCSTDRARDVQARLDPKGATELMERALTGHGGAR